MGRATVLGLITIQALVLLEFNIMHQWLHRSWILAKSLLREAATLGPSAGFQTTASSVESSALANSRFSTISNISLWYRINRRGPNTLPCCTPEIQGSTHSQHHQPWLSAYGRKGTLYKWTAHCHLHQYILIWIRDHCGIWIWIRDHF